MKSKQSQISGTPQNASIFSTPRSSPRPTSQTNPRQTKAHKASNDNHIDSCDGSTRWVKVLCAVSALWVQGIFAGAILELPWLFKWGLASFLVVLGLGLMGLGLARAKRDLAAQALPKGTAYAEGFNVAVVASPGAHCSLCDAITARSHTRPGECLSCGLDSETAARPETQRALRAYHELGAWVATIDDWLARPEVAAQQVFHCSAALVAFVAEFPCLQSVQAGAPGSVPQQEHTLDVCATNEHEALSRSTYDRTWGDAEFVLDEVCAALEKTRVDSGGGSQRGLLIEAERYTRQLRAQLRGHICAAVYCADELLAVEVEQVTTIIPSLSGLPSLQNIPEMQAVPQTVMIPQVQIR